MRSVVPPAFSLMPAVIITNSESSITIDNRGLGTQRGSVTKVSPPPSRAAHDHDHPGAAAYDRGEVAQN
jgi:hypothetical protein